MNQRTPRNLLFVLLVALAVLTLPSPRATAEDTKALDLNQESGSALLDVMDFFYSRFETIDRSTPEGHQEYQRFLNDLDQALVAVMPLRSATKSPADCTTSCNLATTALLKANQAYSRAIKDSQECTYNENNEENWPNYIASALQKSQTAAFFGASAKAAACASNPDRYIVAPMLDNASSLSLQAWTENYYAYARNGCAGASGAAAWASDAYVYFNNAEFYMWSCT